MAKHEAKDGARARGADGEKEARRRPRRETPEKKPAAAVKRKNAPREEENSRPRRETPEKKPAAAAKRQAAARRDEESRRPKRESAAPPAKPKKPAKAEPPEEAPKGKHSVPETAEAPTPKGKHSAPETEAAPTPKGKHSAPETETAPTPKGKHSAPETEAAPTPKGKHSAPEEEAAQTPKGKHSAPETEAAQTPKGKHSAPETEAAQTPKGKHSAPETAETPTPKGKHSVPETAETPAPKGKHSAPETEAAPTPKGKHSAPEPEAAPAPKGKPDGAEKEEAAPPKKKKRQRSIEDYLDAAPQKAPKRPSKRQLRRERAIRRAVIVAVSVCLALLFGALYAGSCVTSSRTNLPNVYLDGIAVGGLTKEETAALLSEQGWDQETQRPLRVELPAGVSFEVNKLKAGSALPLQKAVNAAFAYGHSGSWLADLASWLRSASGGVNLGDFAVTLDGDYLDSLIRDALVAFTEATAPEQAYTVDTENECLRLRKGAGAVTLNAGRLSAAVREALLSKQETLRYEELDNLPGAPDFEAIYQTLAVEPQDAYFTEDWEVVDEVVGCTFSVEQALSVWDETPWLDEALIPLDITWPEQTGAELRSLLFRDKLGEQTSYYPNSIQNRISNIQLAASKIDGVVLKPGEVFSYNETVGERTLDNGFLLAAAYSNGEVVEELGGGICQVSSTLYCAVLYSQLNLRSRDSHYFKVDYLPWGQDATVSWPSPDFKFVNSRDYPIRIHAVADPVERSITVEIWGTDTLGTHLELYEDRYTIYDETWGVATGWNVYLYARVYDADGNLIETRELPASTYHKHDEDIDWPAAKYEADAAQNG